MVQKNIKFESVQFTQYGTSKDYMTTVTVTKIFWSIGKNLKKLTFRQI